MTPRRKWKCSGHASLVAAAVSVIVVILVTPVGAQVANQVGDAIEIGGAMQYDVYRNRDAVKIPLPVEVQSLPFRLRLATYDPPTSSDWLVDISSSSGVKYSYDGTVFNTPTHDILTALFPAGTKTISLLSTGEAPPLRAIEVIVYRSPPAPLSTVDTSNSSGMPNTPNFIDLTKSRQARRADPELLARLNAAVDAMVRLEIEDVKNRLIYACSGVLVSSSIIMTNHHCLTEPAGSDLRIRGWLHGLSPNSGSDAATFQSLNVVPLALYKANAPRYADVALLMTPQPIADVMPAKLATDLPTDLSSLVVLQYPNIDGLPELLRLNDDSDCILDSIFFLLGTQPRPVLMHGCDTDHGSSGSPIWARSFKGGIVALHFWGHNKNEGLKNRAENIPEVIAILAKDPEPIVKSFIEFQRELP